MAHLPFPSNAGKDWNDVEKNCHQPCPSGESMECEDPEHYCWAFVTVCRERTKKPTDSPTLVPTRAPVTDSPTLDPDSPTTPQPTDPPTDLYGLLEGQKDRFYCAVTWDGILCGESIPCPSGNDGDCPTGQSCFSSTIDCSAPQPPKTDAPVERPTPSPARGAQAKPSSPSAPIDNEGEDWGSQNIDNEGEDWGNKNIDNEGENWGDSSQEVDNEGENWGDGSDSFHSGNPPQPTKVPLPKGPTPLPTPEPSIDLLSHMENLKTSYYCSESWDAIDCENAQPCPSGDSKECPKKQQCFSGTPCEGKKPSGGGGGKKPSSPDGSASPTVWTPFMGGKDDGNSKTQSPVNEVTSKFFCGYSWGEVVADCSAAEPCPSGTNADCPSGKSCFAETPCGAASSSSETVLSGSSSHNFAAMVGDIPDSCNNDNGLTMSRNVGYWQSWSI